MSDNNIDFQIDLVDIFKSLWSEKLFIGIGTSILCLISIIYALSLPNLYTSSALLKLSENEDSSSFSGLAAQYGSIASLAGISLPSESADKSDYVIEIIKSLQDSLKKNNGSIVLFSTVAVQKGFTNHAIIASAKGAIEGLTVSLAAEFAPNIRVNCIAPTLTNSKMSQNILKSKLMAEGIAKSHPMKRVGKPEDVASMAKFLLTDESPFITGQIIGVDGGKSSLN